MSSVLSILFGVSIIFTVTFLMIWFFTFLYFKIAKRKEGNYKGVWLPLYLALYNLFTYFMVFAFFTSSIYLFVVAAFLLLLTGFYFIMIKVRKANPIDGIYLSIGLAVVLNPGWLKFLGLI